MNIQLSNTEEYIDRKHTGTLGQVLIRYGRTRLHCWENMLTTWTRCNNVLWISAAKGVEMNGEGPDTKMED
jgi:small nuclear ribonucleoprotein F